MNGVEYRVRWREAGSRQVKSFSDPARARAFYESLLDVATATNAEIRGREVGPWVTITDPTSLGSTS